MTKEELITIINYIVNQGLLTIQANTDKKSLPLDLVDIFAKNEQEYQELTDLVSTLGKPVQDNNIYLLDMPIETKAGELKLLKIRKPDKSKPFRGAPDFKVGDYNTFKDKHQKEHNFSLITRKDYEMIELKGDDILVYFPSKALGEELGI